MRSLSTIERDKKKETNMKTISEEYVIQLEQLHDQKASFGDAKGCLLYTSDAADE